MTETQYGSLREKIAAEKAARQARYAEFQRIYDNAVVAGRHAGTNVVPEPMYITGYDPVMDGVCGFAWVNVRPGNSSFALWLKREGYARTDSYYGGVTIWISGYGQSYDRKMAHASAMADMLKSDLPDLRIDASGRLD